MIQDKQKLKEEWSKFLQNDVLQDDQYCYALTGTYAQSACISRRKIEKDIVHYKNVLDKQVLGNLYKKHKVRLPGFLVIEGQEHGSHYHIHGCIKYYNLKQHIMLRKRPFQDVWGEAINRSGKLKVEQIDDLRGWVNYLLKDRSKDGVFSDGIPVFHKFNPRGTVIQAPLSLLGLYSGLNWLIELGVLRYGL